VICSLAFTGIVLFCSFLVPTLENMYQSMRIPEGSGLHVVKTLKSTLPYWIAIPPIGLVLLVGWTRFSSSPALASGLAGRVLAWLPGMSKTVFEHRCMNFSETLASLLDAGVPLPEGLRLAAAAWEDTALEQGTRSLAASLERGEVPDDGSPFAAGLPPFLRWAIWHADDTVGRSRALRMASNTYRQSARRRIERLRVAAPNLACVVIGGGVTLLYGLALFVPVAQMIRELAS
jgi:type II secretory pathway component PulF